MRDFVRGRSTRSGRSTMPELSERPRSGYLFGGLSLTGRIDFTRVSTPLLSLSLSFLSASSPSYCFFLFSSLRFFFLSSSSSSSSSILFHFLLLSFLFFFFLSFCNHPLLHCATSVFPSFRTEAQRNALFLSRCLYSFIPGSRVRKDEWSLGSGWTPSFYLSSLARSFGTGAL